VELPLSTSPAIVGRVQLGPIAAAPAGGDRTARTFRRQAKRHAERFRSVLNELSDAAPVWREKELVETLGLDRSVVGRIVRASRTDNDLELLSELPSPEGLRIIFEAATRTGLLNEDGFTRAANASAEFDAFLDDYPGKRRAFLVRLASDLPSERASADRVARRAMFRASSDLLGYRLQHAVLTMVVVDGCDPERFDAYHMFAKYGLERTRADGPPIIVGSLRTGPQGPGVAFEPIDPNADPADAASALMLDHCSGPALVTLVRTSAGFTELHLDADHPPVQELADIVVAQRAPGTLLRKSRPGFAHEWRRVVTRIPAERLTVDFIFGPGTYQGCELRTSEHLYRAEVPPPPSADGVRRADQLRGSARVSEVDRGIAGLSIRGLPGYRSAVADLVAAAAVEPGRCRVVRVTKDFPELNGDLMCWITLPE